MADVLLLRIAELRAALDQVLREAEATLGSDVNLPWDHYWHLPIGSTFDVHGKPEELTIGQLSDDLKSMPSDPAPETVGHHLAHLTGLLRALERLTLP